MKIITGIVVLLAGTIFSIVMWDSILSVANGKTDWGAETFKMWLMGGVFAFLVLGYLLAIYTNRLITKGTEE